MKANVINIGDKVQLSNRVARVADIQRDLAGVVRVRFEELEEQAQEAAPSAEAAQESTAAPEAVFNVGTSEGDQPQ